MPEKWSYQPLHDGFQLNARNGTAPLISVGKVYVEKDAQAIVLAMNADKAASEQFCGAVIAALMKCWNDTAPTTANEIGPWIERQWKQRTAAVDEIKKLEKGHRILLDTIAAMAIELHCPADGTIEN